MEHVMRRLDEIRPYENNPRNNEKSVDRVAKSIKEFGFLQPIVCDRDGVILAGHTRYAASKKLGLKEVPVIYADGLTEGQARAYRLIDNKAGEESEWVEELLGKELEAVLLEAPEIEPADFGFSGSGEVRRKKSWENAGKRCGMDKDIRIREKCGFLFTAPESTSVPPVQKPMGFASAPGYICSSSVLEALLWQMMSLFPSRMYLPSHP